MGGPSIDEPLFITCAKCGSQKQVPTRTLQRIQRFCARSCGYAHRGRRTQFKACPICAKPFKVNYDARVTCSKPCCIVHLRVKMAGKTPHKAVIAHALKRRKQAEAKALDLFGALTAREVAIFNHAARVGYRRGYQFGKHREEAA